MELQQEKKTIEKIDTFIYFSAEAVNTCIQGVHR